MQVDVVGNFLVISGASYEQSRWLGDQGWWYHGPKSQGKYAKILHGLGLSGHFRYLPVSECAIAAKVADVEALGWTPAARAHVDAYVAQLRASAEVASDFDVPAPDGLVYRPYQRAGVEVIMRQWNAMGAIIGDEMGLGKTMQAIGAIACAEPRRVLVMCLTSIRENWRRELVKWLPSRETIVATMAEELVEGTVSVVSYSSLQGSSERAVTLREALMSLHWDLVVLDEAHVLKNPKSQISQRVLGSWKKGKLATPGITQHSARTLILSGTIVQNRMIESLPLLRAVGLVGSSDSPLGDEGRYLYRYCGPQKKWAGHSKGYVTTFFGSTNLDELQAKLRASGRFVRRLKKDVAKELPPKQRSLIVIERDAGWESDALDDIEPKTMAEVGKLLATPAAFKQISRYRARLAKRKAPLVIEHVTQALEGLGDTGKVLVFAHHKTLLDALEKAFAGSCIRIDGDTPPAERQPLVDRFQDEAEIRVAILSTRAAGTGLNMTAASLVIFGESDWNPAACVQAEDRAHRIGSTGECLSVQYFVVDGTLDAHVTAVMTAKMAIADAALDKSLAPSVALPEAPPPPPAAVPEAEPDVVSVVLKTKQGQEVVSLSADQREAIAEGLLYIAGQCDGAKQDDDVGFNGVDAHSEFVQSLVKAAPKGLTPKQAAWGRKVLTTYRNTQMPATLRARIWEVQHAG